MTSDRNKFSQLSIYRFRLIAETRFGSHSSMLERMLMISKSPQINYSKKIKIRTHHQSRNILPDSNFPTCCSLHRCRNHVQRLWSFPT